MPQQQQMHQQQLTPQRATFPWARRTLVQALNFSPPVVFESDPAASQPSSLQYGADPTTEGLGDGGPRALRDPGFE